MSDLRPFAFARKPRSHLLRAVELVSRTDGRATPSVSLIRVNTR